MKTISLLLALAAAPAFAGTVILEPTDTSTTYQVGAISGLWKADGTQRPIGGRVTMKPLAQANSITWQLINNTTSEVYVAYNTFFVTPADWSSLPGLDSDGFKTFDIATLNSTFGTPQAGDDIFFEVQEVNTSLRWDLKASAFSNDSYTMAAVPEPSSAIVAFLAAVVGSLYWTTRNVIV